MGFETETNESFRAVIIFPCLIFWNIEAACFNGNLQFVADFKFFFQVEKILCVRLRIRNVEKYFLISIFQINS